MNKIASSQTEDQKQCVQHNTLEYHAEMCIHIKDWVKGKRNFYVCALECVMRAKAIGQSPSCERNYKEQANKAD